MEGLGGDGPSQVAPIAKWKNDFSRAFQYYLDRCTPHPVQRWLGTLVAAAIYILRVYYLQGFYIISYGLGIYILNLLIGFLSPKVDPELEALDGASLPTKGSDEFRPFIRRLPEFKFCVTRNYFENLVRALENGLSDVDSQVVSSKSASSRNAAGTSKAKGGKGKASARSGGSSKNLDDSGSWSCDQCTFLNSSSATSCQMCTTRR